jgi:hypothetical protein
VRCPHLLIWLILWRTALRWLPLIPWRTTLLLLLILWRTTLVLLVLLLLVEDVH